MKTYLFVVLALTIISCTHNQDHLEQDDQHEEVKIQLTAYSNEFELFAEADPFVLGHSSEILAHFTHLTDFTALKSTSTSISASLIVNDKETSQTLEKPLRKGIYMFVLTPEKEGKGKLIFDIKTEKGNYQVVVSDLIVFNDEHDAEHEAEELEVAETNATVFTKEQSWKIDFATELVRKETFGQVIKTTGLIQSAPTDETIISAKTNGFIQFSNGNLSEGITVKSGQSLLTISGNELAENNANIRFTEAKNNYEKTKQNYERLKTLVADKIVSEKEVLEAKNQFLNAKVLYETLNSQFSVNGQNVKSTANGFIKHLFVKNGEYVNAGQALLSISKNEKLLITADVQQKYVSVLGQITTANICTSHNQKNVTLEELNGKVLSYGKSTNIDNYLIPVTL
jgi:cobalt-zinc-cadmium efflux system membrane fusion protein